jgi:hypothetical protein
MRAARPDSSKIVAMVVFLSDVQKNHYAGPIQSAA